MACSWCVGCATPSYVGDRGHGAPACDIELECANSGGRGDASDAALGAAIVGLAVALYVAASR